MVCDFCPLTYFAASCNHLLFSLFVGVSAHTAHSERPASRSPPVSERSPPVEAGMLFYPFSMDTFSFSFFSLIIIFYFNTLFRKY
jgi:hypothetical protein